MTQFQSKQTRELTKLGKALVDAYNKVPGSSGPYANPESLEAVVEELVSIIDYVDLTELEIFKDTQ